MEKDLMVVTGYDVSSIKDATLRRATKGMATAIANGVKSGWQFAFNAAVAKEAFNVPKGQELPVSLKSQFGTLKAYCEAVGVSTASIHNSAKALKFMTDEGLVPKKLLKNGDDAIDFDRFTLSVGQAVELAAYSEDQLAALKALCEKEGFSINTLSTATIRRFKNTGSLLAEGTHKQIESKDSKDSKDSKVIKVSEDEIEAADVTKEQVIDTILAMMTKYEVKMTELAKAYNEMIKK